MTEPSVASVSADDAQLRALGYSAKFDRSMSLWENFALGFTYLSPVVGVYSVFAGSLQAAGPPFIWSYLLAGAGQMLVCLVFSEIVAQYPISGGLYPWTRRLVGKRWAWMAGWVYGWALFTTIAAVATGAAPFLADFLGFEATPGVIAAVGLALVLIATLLNLAGTRLLARVALFGFICELLGALAVGIYLFLFQQHNPLAIVLDPGLKPVEGSYLPAFLAGATAGLFCCYGFEACADVAEETPNPGLRIPRAMRMTIYIGIAAAFFVCLALLVALPNLADAISGKEPNPLPALLKSAFGPIGSKLVILVVMVSFLSCVLSLQAAVSRLLFAYGRDRMIAGHGALTKLSAQHVPWIALVVAGLIPGVIIVLGMFLQDAIQTIINAAVAGIYLAFQMVVIAALYARSRGWRPAGAFSLGTWGLAVNVAALVYGIGALSNIMWPRTPDQPWYVNFGMLATIGGIVIAGFAYMAAARTHDRGEAPAGDAWHPAQVPQ
ncbi:MAG TPA: amino acid permease [Stellaceae bacterium]|nr:amino acid permease [Stellaceae bacterium]